MSSYELGTAVRIGPETFTDLTGALTDPTTVTLTLLDPAGATTTPMVVRSSVGVWYSDVTPTLAGRYTFRWLGTGALSVAASGGFDLRAPLLVRAVDLDEVKLRLDKTLAVDDVEIATMIGAAEAEYIEWVGPMSGTVTELYDGVDVIVLRAPRVASLTSVAYTDGRTVTLTDLDLDLKTGILRWGSGVTGRFTPGRRNVTITYTVAALPANHREAIIADIAGYFAATQTGPVGPNDDGYGAGFRADPIVMFPRIRALSGLRVA